MTPRRISAALLVMLVAVLLGVGGYLIGSGAGEDLEKARAEGFAAGVEIGAKAGDRRGFISGYELGKRQGYGAGYQEAFRTAYQAAFREAGLATPKFTEIDLDEGDGGGKD